MCSCGISPLCGLIHQEMPCIHTDRTGPSLFRFGHSMHVLPTILPRIRVGDDRFWFGVLSAVRIENSEEVTVQTLVTHEIPALQATFCTATTDGYTWTSLLDPPAYMSTLWPEYSANTPSSRLFEQFDRIESRLTAPSATDVATCLRSSVSSNPLGVAFHTCE